jgi:hypothetical protein
MDMVPVRLDSGRPAWTNVLTKDATRRPELGVARCSRRRWNWNCPATQRIMHVLSWASSWYDQYDTRTFDRSATRGQNHRSRLRIDDLGRVTLCGLVKNRFVAVIINRSSGFVDRGGRAWCRLRESWDDARGATVTATRDRCYILL